MDMTLRVTGIDFGSDGWIIGYIRIPADVRKNGLQFSHQALVPVGSDYDDEMETASEAILALLRDVLDDETRAEAIEITDDDEDEAEES